MWYRIKRYCRWCSKPYKPKKDIGRDGFCCTACKQALYRARKRYVTQKAIAGGAGYRKRVTQRKKKIR